MGALDRTHGRKSAGMGTQGGVEGHAQCRSELGISSRTQCSTRCFQPCGPELEPFQFICGNEPQTPQSRPTQGAATARRVENQRADEGTVESRTHPQSCNPGSEPLCCPARVWDTHRAGVWTPASQGAHLPRENRPWRDGFALSCLPNLT